MKKHYLLVLSLFVNVLLAVAQSGANDPTFNSTDLGFGYGDGVSGQINGITVQADGKILVCGDFTTFNGQKWTRIARINSDGTPDLTFNPGSGPTNTVSFIKVLSDKKILIGGVIGDYNGELAFGIARLNEDGSRDKSFNYVGSNGTVSSASVQSDGKIIVAASKLLRLNTDGSVDETFSVVPTLESQTGPPPNITSSAIQPDGKILIGGYFQLINGVPRRHIARLNTDGSLDESFDSSNGANGTVTNIHVQADEKIIITGYINVYGGASRNGIARINSNGTLDDTFIPEEGVDDWLLSSALRPDGKIAIGGRFTSYYGASRGGVAIVNSTGVVNDIFNPGTGIEEDQSVNAVAAQADNKILIGGTFRTYNGKSSLYLERLNTDGSIDESFRVAGTGANLGSITTSDFQADEKIIIGGSFAKYNGILAGRLARVNTDGTLDQTFNTGSGTDGWVNKVKVLASGKILVAGNFLTFNGTSRQRIVRLNSNGTVDGTFTGGTDGEIFDFAVQPDNKIVLVGKFGKCNDVSKAFIARINEDGDLDASFNSGAGAGYYINRVAIGADGKIFIGGQFPTYNNISSKTIARLNANGTLDQTFNSGTGISGSNTGNNIFSIIPLEGGKILVGGSMWLYNDQSVPILIRINSDGSLDDSFKLKAKLNGYTSIYAMSMLPDKKILIGGKLSFYNDSGLDVNVGTNIAQLNEDGSLDTSFDTGDGANREVQTILVQSDGKIIIGGFFTSYEGKGRNKIARILKECAGPVTADIPTLSATALGVCSGSSTTLSVTGGVLPSSAEWKWYSGSCGEKLEGTGSTITVSPTATTIYYVRAEGGCVVTGQCATITINLATPTLTVAPVSRCGTGKVTFTAVTDAEQVKWYDFFAGEPIATGLSYETNDLSFGTTFYAEAISSLGCISPRVSAMATVNSALSALTSTLGLTTITATEASAGVTFQWINCETNESLSGETGKQFTPKATGSYAVIVSKDACSVTSACTSVTITDQVTGLGDSFSDKLLVYPNPTSGKVTIDLKAIKTDIEVRDITGGLIYSQDQASGLFELNLNRAEGVYILKAKNAEGTKHMKVLVR